MEENFKKGADFVATQIQIKRGLKADLPILKTGELAFCTDTEELYIGGGATNVLINVPKNISGENYGDEGIGIYKGQDPDDLNKLIFKKLIAGEGIEITEDNGAITITATNPLGPTVSIEIKVNLEGTTETPVQLITTSVVSGVKTIATDSDGRALEQYPIGIEQTLQLVDNTKAGDYTIFPTVTPITFTPIQTEEEEPMVINIDVIRTDLYSPDLIAAINSTILENSGVKYDVVSTFGSTGSAGDKWIGGVLATNGKIYTIPHNATSVLEIDPIARTATTFGSLTGSTKWVGGVLAPNGKIYGIPYSASKILEIDPIARTATTFGSVGTATDKWAGGVLASNGKIYGIPYTSTTVLEIDPIAQTTATFGSLTGSGKWDGGVFATNGKIYGIPSNATNIVEIDPIARTATTFGSLAGTAKWDSGVLASNGKIYGMPRNTTKILEIDPTTRTATTFGTVATGDSKWTGGVLAPNGKIYGMPNGASKILEIDPIAQTVTTFGSVGTATTKYHSGTLASNGKIYGIPCNATAVLEIAPSTDFKNFGPSSLHSAYLNKF